MTNKTIKLVVNTLSSGFILIGLFGMLFCFPFLWSADWADLVGAGFPFVGGSILCAAGLIALALNNRPTNVS
jgi:Fe2+ transport system protein B